MSKASEKQNSRWARYESSGKKIDRMLACYASGVPCDGAQVTAEAIANEIVARGRAHGACLDRSNVSYDGPMIESLEAAMRAAFERGKLAAVIKTDGSLN